jgi:hypothetical protein
VDIHERTLLGVHQRTRGCPQTAVPRHSVTVGARHAVPLPLAYPQGRVRERPRPSPRGAGPPARCRRHNTTGAGLGPAPTWTSAVQHSPFTIHHSPFAIRDSLFAVLAPLAARCSPRAVGVHERRLADTSADCRGKACRAPTPCLPTGLCARAASPIAPGAGPPARCRGHNITGAGLGPAPTWTSTIPHSQFGIRHSRSFSIRNSLFAVLAPLATRNSPLAIRHSLFAIRRSSPLVVSCPCWPLRATLLLACGLRAGIAREL